MKIYDPVSAVGGGFANLPPTPAPMGMDLGLDGQKRCTCCRLMKTLHAFRYSAGHANAATTCKECRDGAEALRPRKRGPTKRVSEGAQWISFEQAEVGKTR